MHLFGRFCCVYRYKTKKDKTAFFPETGNGA